MQLANDCTLRLVKAVRPLEELQKMHSCNGPSIGDGHVGFSQRDHDVMAPHRQRDLAPLTAATIDVETAPIEGNPRIAIEHEVSPRYAIEITCRSQRVHLRLKFW